MSDLEVAVCENTRAAEGGLTWMERQITRALARTFGPGAAGCLTIEFPSGALRTFGNSAGPAAIVSMQSGVPVWRLLTRGSLGLAESYMRGEIEAPDLKAVLAFLNCNYPALEKAGGGVAKPRFSDIRWHRRRDNSRKGSRRNIAAHYDLGNDFYKLWLDCGMTYSSGIFRSGATTLAAAQDEKYTRVLQCLGLRPGDSLLEIGCGWGGLAERAASAGLQVTGLTVSGEQLAYARARMSHAGYSRSVDLRFEDYRDSTGTFDAIASIEMIEAVGEAHWHGYFKTIAARLKPGGHAAIQAITIDEKYFASYRRQADFIQRYIFPGGMLPTVERMTAESKAAGLGFETVERFGRSYARTLGMWRQRFISAWPEIQKLGFDERFRRMWLYYLIYCEVAFESGDVDVGIYKLTKPNTA